MTRNITAAQLEAIVSAREASGKPGEATHAATCHDCGEESLRHLSMGYIARTVDGYDDHGQLVFSPGPGSYHQLAIDEIIQCSHCGWENWALLEGQPSGQANR